MSETPGCMLEFMAMVNCCGMEVVEYWPDGLTDFMYISSDFALILPRSSEHRYFSIQKNSIKKY